MDSGRLTIVGRPEVCARERAAARPWLPLAETRAGGGHSPRLAYTPYSGAGFPINQWSNQRRMCS